MVKLDDTDFKSWKIKQLQVSQVPHALPMPY